MNSPKFKIFILFLLGFLTGINFVIFPALSAVFTDENLFGLSSSQFGNLFIPQVICIIVSCLLAPFLVNKFGPKKVLISGTLLMILTTGILWSLQFFIYEKQLLFPILMLLVALLGSGFGLSITTLNPLVASFFPNSKSAAILILNFLVGLGTSTAPLMMNLIGNVKNWILLPGIIFVVVAIVFVFLILLKFEKENFFELPKQFKIPSKLWLFFITIIIYGFIEGTFGSFGAIILKNLGLSTNHAILGLSLFWGGIAINRLCMGLLTKKFNLSNVFLLSPIFVGILLLVLLNSSGDSLILFLMFTIGFFMGSIFPGSIAWGTVEFPSISVMVSGFLMAANQIGTGVVTNVLGNFADKTPLILKYLSFSTVAIFLLLILLKRNSKIKEAF